MFIEGFHEYSSFKNKYLTIDREPFFKLAADLIRDDHTVLDIGSGEGDFFLYLQKRGIQTKNVYLLDSNPQTVEGNKAITENSMFYFAPEKLQFEDKSIDLIHMSHLIDNLCITDLYNFLIELNRVLKPGGHLIVSTPLLWPGFYDDLSHVKPYNPYVFFKYFVQQGRHSRFKEIENNYSIENLVYRYYELPLDEGWSSTIPLIDFFFISFKRILRKLGIKRLRKNGYTMIMRKGLE